MPVPPVPIPGLLPTPRAVRRSLAPVCRRARALGTAALPSAVATPLSEGLARGLSAVRAVTALPGLAQSLAGLRETTVQLERLATFAAGELPEAVYQLESISTQLDAMREQLTAIELQLAALRPVSTGSGTDADHTSDETARRADAAREVDDPTRRE